MASIKTNEKVGEVVYDDIFAATSPTAHAVPVKLDESEGPIERGTVIVASEAGGNCKPASQALTATDQVFVLAETVESATAGDIAEAYECGSFIKGRLATDGEYELTDADLEILRKSGILVQDYIPFNRSECL